jgi:hypothetical protein
VVRLSLGDVPHSLAELSGGSAGDKIVTRNSVALRITLEYTARTLLVGGLLAIPYTVQLIALRLIYDELTREYTYEGSSLLTFCVGFSLILIPVAAIALTVGAVLGLIVGFVNGIVIGALTVTVFYPLTDTRRYFFISGAVGTLTSIFLMLVATPIALGQITSSPYYSVPLAFTDLSLNNWLVLVALPALLSGIVNWWVCYHAVQAYVESTAKTQQS